MSNDTEHRAPDPHTACVEILRAHADMGGRWPAEMPIDYDAAGRWWLGMCEPPNPRWDQPRTITTREGERTEYPYIQRVTATLRRFVRCSEKFQRLIVRAAEDGIRWRGETEPMFHRVIAEHEKMQEMGTEEYRKQGSKALRRFAQEVTE